MLLPNGKLPLRVDTYSTYHSLQRALNSQLQDRDLPRCL